jgi:peroxiredoxin
LNTVPDLAAPNQPQQTAATGSRPSLRYVLLALVTVVAILGGAWLIGDRQDFGSIGQGGVLANPLPSVGEQAPQLLTFTADGSPVRLSDLRGYPVWLNFWGSWCYPCRTEMPELQAAYETLQPQGLIMLGVSMREDPATAVEYARRVGATFPILADPNYLTAILPPEEYPEVRKLLETWQVNNFPTHIFINRDGTIEAVVLQQMDYETAVAYGERILASPPRPGVPVATPVPDGTPASPIVSPAARREPVARRGSVGAHQRAQPVPPRQTA